MTVVPALPLTKEHGSWAVMAVPLIVGTAAAERILWDHAVLAMCAVSAFLAYVPAQVLIGQGHGRRVGLDLAAAALWWLRALTAMVLLSLGWLVSGGVWSVLAWGSVAFIGFVANEAISRRFGKTFWGDLVASLALSTGAPAALMLDGTSHWMHALTLWTLVSLFFGCSVAYVHLKIRAVAERFSGRSLRSRLRFGWVTLAYHAVVILLVAAIVAAGRTGALTLVAFLPMAFHALLGTVRLAGQVRFRRLGLLLLGHSLVFAVLMVLAWRAEP